MNIRELPQHQKPREKLIRLGQEALSDIELITLILSSGNKKHNVSALAQKVYAVLLKNTPTINALTRINGIGVAKATTIIAATELTRRLQIINQQTTPLTTATEVYNYAKHIFTNNNREEFHILLLNTQLEPIGHRLLFLGTIDKITVHAREVFHTAISQLAHSIIVLHNHPSGNPTPSREDILLTQQLIHIGDIIGIPVLDHMILGRNSYWSYAKEHGN